MPKTISYQVFWRRVTADGRAPCELSHADCHRCGGDGLDWRNGEAHRCSMCDGKGVWRCSNVIDAHHFIPKQRIDLKLGGKHSDRAIAAKQDVRNGVALCRSHHDLVEAGFYECPRPAMLAMFCVDHGLDVPTPPAPRAGVPRRSDSPGARSGVSEEANSPRPR